MLAATVETLPNGKRLRVARAGAGRPVLFLHGYPDNLQIWCELVPRLTGVCQCIALDWPGMGQSEAWPGGATPSHMAERVLTLLDFWGIDRATLVGTDMGGQPALAFAALYPDRIDRLVVMNSLVFGDEATSWEIRILRQFGWNRLILRYLPWAVFRRVKRTFLPRGVRLPAELEGDLWESFRRPEVRAFIAKMCAGYQGTLPRLPALYAQVRCPTLVLWAGRDKHFPQAHAERLHAAIPGSQLAILADAEHWMMWYRAGEVAEVMSRFLGDQVKASGRG
jgi:pimeloyl-ACP methyl ester carboxylesterase